MAKTALELSQKEWREYRPSRVLEAREERESKIMAQRKKEAWDLAKNAAHLLRKEFGAERVVVFGSLAHGQWLTPWSDIDLAAWGIAPTRF
jgi:tRNA nucleotidyltransferase (CCA-adding enzyme)